MAGGQSHRARLTIEVEPELRRKVKVAAAERDLSVREYVVAILQRALAEEEGEDESAQTRAWSQISARSFARDWESQEDEVYDHLR